MINDLYSIKLDAIETYLNSNPEIDFKYWDIAIEGFYLKTMMKQRRSPIISKFDKDLFSIFSEMLTWMKSYKPKNNKEEIKTKKHLYFIKRYLKTGIYSNKPPQKYDQEYVNIIKQEYLLLNECESDLDKVNSEIRKFYIENELIAREMSRNATTITKEESDRLIDSKIKEYNKIIGLLQQKYKILKELSFKPESDPLKELQRIDFEIESYKIKAEIESKKEFLKIYVERKNII